MDVTGIDFDRSIGIAFARREAVADAHDEPVSHPDRGLRQLRAVRQRHRYRDASLRLGLVRLEGHAGFDLAVAWPLDFGGEPARPLLEDGALGLPAASACRRLG